MFCSSVALANRYLHSPNDYYLLMMKIPVLTSCSGGTFVVSRMVLILGGIVRVFFSFSEMTSNSFNVVVSKVNEFASCM